MEKFIYPTTKEKRKERLARASTLLKEKYVGIDDQIDLVIKKISFWYISPEVVQRPIIINLWGTTGVGKTDLVRDLKSYLGFDSMFVETVFSDHKNDTSLLNHIESECERISLGEPGILVLDEFQRYRTKNEDGTARTGLGYKDVWQILSDGKIMESLELEDMSSVQAYFNYRAGEKLFSNVSIHSIINNIDEYEDDISKYQLDGVYSVLQNHRSSRKLKKSEEGVSKDRAMAIRAAIDKSQINSRKSTTPAEQIKMIRSLLTFKNPENIYFIENYLLGSKTELMGAINQFKKVSKFLYKKGYDHDNSVEEVMEAIDQFIEDTDSTSVSFDYDYTKAVIFVIGNLDSVYEEATGIDSPFIPADIYRKWCSAINIFSVKKELSSLFFPEQVSRLGNIHIVYPTLGEEHFRKLIDIKVNETVNHILSADERFKDIHFLPGTLDYIYRNGVYPLQGVRPVLSTINDVCNNLLHSSYELEVEAGSELFFDYSPDKDLFFISSKPEGKEVTFRQTGDKDKVLEKIRLNGPFLWLKCYHEMGHSAMNYKVFGKAPVCSFLTERDALTVTSSPYAPSFNKNWNDCLILLAGYVAVETFYKSLDTNHGFEVDLNRVSSIVKEMIHEQGYYYKLKYRVTRNPLKKIWYKFKENDLVSQIKLKGAQGLSPEYLIRDMHKEEERLINKAINKMLSEVRKAFKDKALLKSIHKSSELLYKNLYVADEDLEYIFKKHGLRPNNFTGIISFLDE